MVQLKEPAVYCVDCFDQLTPGEVHWFGYRCEACEVLWAERVDAWRRGAHDPALERAFTEQKVH